MLYCINTESNSIQKKVIQAISRLTQNAMQLRLSDWLILISLVKASILETWGLNCALGSAAKSRKDGVGVCNEKAFKRASITQGIWSANIVPFSQSIVKNLIRTELSLELSFSILENMAFIVY